MAALNFPISPTVGQIYSGYVWDGAVWRSLGSPTQGKTAQTRGRFPNVGFQHSQQNANTAATTDGYWPADQWSIWRNMGTGTLSVGRVLKTTPRGSKYRIRATVTAAQASLTAAQYSLLETYVEGIDWGDLLWGTAAAKPAVLRFGVNLPAGLWAISLMNSPITRTFIGTFTISAAQAGTDVEIQMPISGDVVTATYISNPGVKGLIFDLCLAAGSNSIGVAGWQAGAKSNITGAANLYATNGQVCELFDVDIFADPDNTGIAPPWVPRDPVTELAKMMRFWQQVQVYSASSSITTGTVYNGYGKVSAPYPSTVTLSGANQFNTGFAATVGTLGNTGDTITENRTSNATVANGGFRTLVTVNARLLNS